ncbi:MAG: metallophosphoesterase [Deltaproteobacteria bacterium]|nr:metallophosphoesterase [Deltaproteobacteria bacterium]
MNYIIVSDLHLSTEELLDDFYSDEDFAQMLNLMSRGEPTTLIFNGDTIDFLQSYPSETSLQGNPRLYNDSDSSAKILDRVYKRHQTFFGTLSNFLKNPRNQIVVLKGNHDAEFAFDTVQKKFRELIGEEHKDQILFPEYGYYIEEKGVYVEHGNQFDKLNSFSNFQSPFHDIKKKHIELPFGSILVKILWNKLEKSFPFIDKIRPMTASISLAIAQRPLFWVFRFDYFLDMFFHMAKRDFNPSNLIRKSIDEKRLSKPELISASLTNLLNFGGLTLLTIIFMVSFFFIKGLFFLDVSKKSNLDQAIDFTLSSLTEFSIFLIISTGFYIVGKFISNVFGKKPTIAYPINIFFRILIGISFGILIYGVMKFFWIPIVILLIVALIIDVHRSITKEISSQPEEIDRPFPEEIEVAKRLLKIPELRYVIFGHTHFPRFLMVDELKYLINSGTWIYNLDLYSLQNRNLMQTFVFIDDQNISLNVFYGLKGYKTLKSVSIKQ